MVVQLASTYPKGYMLLTAHRFFPLFPSSASGFIPPIKTIMSAPG